MESAVGLFDRSPGRVLRQAVGAVLVPEEVGGVAAGIPQAVLRQEDTVRVLGPPRASTPNVVRSETLGQPTSASGPTNISHEATHGRSMGPISRTRNAPAADALLTASPGAAATRLLLDLQWDSEGGLKVRLLPGLPLGGPVQIRGVCAGRTARRKFAAA